MFKKAVEVKKTQQRLSGADRKKLKRTVKQRFLPNEDEDEETHPNLDALLPPKGGSSISLSLTGIKLACSVGLSTFKLLFAFKSAADITVSKYPNRILVYGIEGGFPMFFDVDGRGTEIYPTVYALWMVPELLPTFMVRAGEVSRFLIGGADLMFPGIYIPEEGLPSFSAGEAWAVLVPGNPAPIAVGSTTMSSDEALRAGLRGKALRITHCYGDSLWGSVEGRHVPNAGFYEDVVFHDPALLSSLQTSVLCEADKGAGDASDGDVSNIYRDSVSNDYTTESSVRHDGVDQVVMGLDELRVTEDVLVDGSNVEDQHSKLSTEDVDALLDQCLLQALHTTLKDKDLPIPGSTLWSSHVLQCRPSGVTLDIKKSSHKKLSKWLLSKVTAGLISAKEDKYKKEVILSKVNRNHPEYKSFTPEKREVVKTEQNDQTSTQTVPNKVVEVTEVYKPSVHVNPIFTSLGADKSKFYSASEAIDVVFSYIEQEKLVKPTDKSVVVLDAVLCDALYKGVIKKGSTYPTEVHKKDVGAAFVSRMQAHHLVTRGSESVIKKGALKTVQILTERRQGNKKVTKLSGFESFLLDADSLASELQKKFACSTSVTELPGKKGHEVLVQGGVIDNLGKHLVDHYGIPKRYIEILDKTRK